MKSVEELLLEQVKALVEQRKELDALRDDLSGIKMRNKNADLELMSLPHPVDDGRERTSRANLVDFIRKVSWRDAQAHINLWRNLYKEYKLRYGVDLKSEAKKHNMNKTQYAEAFGHMDNLYALAVKLYGE